MSSSSAGDQAPSGLVDTPLARLRLDAGTHFPRGQRAKSTGLFDLSIAAVSLALGGGFALTERRSLVHREVRSSVHT